MNKSFFSLFLLAFSCLMPRVDAQENFQCGNKYLPEIKRQMLQNREEMRGFIYSRDAITYVPVRFFMVAESNGTGRASEKVALKALCLLNESYAEMDIQFYLKGFKYFNNSTVYDNPGSFAGANAIGNQMIYNALNVFIVKDAGGGAAAYYQPPAGPNGGADWIVASSTYADDSRVLAHEVGHFFSLPHTFYGWEPSGGWNFADHGNPVMLTFAPDDNTLIEFVDGSNCQDAGDGFCDTPADFMFPSNECNYNGNVQDAHNDLLTPDEDNYMNYFFSCGEYFWTDEQKDAAVASLFHSSRNYVRPNYTPNTDEVTGTPTLVSPAQNEEIPSYNFVVLDWQPVTGADRYMVELTGGPSQISERIIVENETSLNLTELDPDGAYFWRVMAFNESSTCSNFSVNRLLKTGTTFSDSFELTNVQGWSISPNPVANNLPISVNVESLTGVNTSVKLTTITGQVIEATDYYFPAGISTLEFSATTALPAGVYFVTLQTREGAETKRVVVAD